jgi:anti-sigma B factor antagonist
LKLSLETRYCNKVAVVHCHGRIVYRDEAASFSRLVGDLVGTGGRVVVDLSGVHFMDGAGLGELVLLHTWSRTREAEMKCAGPSPFVRHLLDLTRVDSLVEIHPTLNHALAAFDNSREAACANR